jgi:hypothetical protein
MFSLQIRYHQLTSSLLLPNSLGKAADRLYSNPIQAERDSIFDGEPQPPAVSNAGSTAKIQAASSALTIEVQLP